MASENEASCESDPNFAVICGFLEKFSVTCGLANIDFVDLQEMLENTQEVPPDLIELHIKLMRRAKKSVASSDKWEKALIKTCHTFSSQDAWEIERFGYKKARITSKLRILKELLEMQFDYNQKFKNEINKMSATDLRSQPLGRDRLGRAYWYQCDESCQVRVYKDDPDDETWTLVAKDRVGLVSLISQLGNGDAIKSSSEPVSNEDSNSIEVEKPILDTGQNKNASPNPTNSNLEIVQEEKEGENENTQTEITPINDDKVVDKIKPKEDKSAANAVDEVKGNSDKNEQETEELNNKEESKSESPPEESKIEEENSPTIVEETVEDSEKPVPEESCENALNLCSKDLSNKQESKDEKTCLDLSVKTGPCLRIKPITELMAQPQHVEMQKKEFMGIKGKYIRSDGMEKGLLYPNPAHLGKAVQSASYDAICYKRAMADEIYSVPTNLKHPRFERPTLLGNKKYMPYIDDEEEDEDDEVEDEVEEPLMLVQGEGSGFPNESGCEEVGDSPIVGEEIEEPMLYVFGEGSGKDCNTGNKRTTTSEERKEEEPSDNDERVTKPSKSPRKLGTIIDSKTDKINTKTVFKSRWDVKEKRAEETKSSGYLNSINENLGSAKSDDSSKIIESSAEVTDSPASIIDTKSITKSDLDVEDEKRTEETKSSENVNSVNENCSDSTRSNDASDINVERGVELTDLPDESIVDDVGSPIKQTFFFGSRFSPNTSPIKTASLSFGATTVLSDNQNSDTTRISPVAFGEHDEVESSKVHSDKTDQNLVGSTPSQTKVPENVDIESIDNNEDVSVASPVDVSDRLLPMNISEESAAEISECDRTTSVYNSDSSASVQCAEESKEATKTAKTVQTLERPTQAAVSFNETISDNLAILNPSDNVDVATGVSNLSKPSVGENAETHTEVTENPSEAVISNGSIQNMENAECSATEKNVTSTDAEEKPTTISEKAAVILKPSKHDGSKITSKPEKSKDLKISNVAEESISNKSELTIQSDPDEVKATKELKDTVSSAIAGNDNIPSSTFDIKENISKESSDRFCMQMESSENKFAQREQASDNLNEKNNVVTRLLPGEKKSDLKKADNLRQADSDNTFDFLDEKNQTESEIIDIVSGVSTQFSSDTCAKKLSTKGDVNVEETQDLSHKENDVVEEKQVAKTNDVVKEAESTGILENKHAIKDSSKFDMMYDQQLPIGNFSPSLEAHIEKGKVDMNVKEVGKNDESKLSDELSTENERMDELIPLVSVNEVVSFKEKDNSKETEISKNDKNNLHDEHSNGVQATDFEEKNNQLIEILDSDSEKPQESSSSEKDAIVVIDDEPNEKEQSEDNANSQSLDTKVEKHQSTTKIDNKRTFDVEKNLKNKYLEEKSIADKYNVHQSQPVVVLDIMKDPFMDSVEIEDDSNSGIAAIKAIKITNVQAKCEIIEKACEKVEKQKQPEKIDKNIKGRLPEPQPFRFLRGRRPNQMLSVKSYATRNKNLVLRKETKPQIKVVEKKDLLVNNSIKKEDVIKTHQIIENNVRRSTRRKPGALEENIVKAEIIPVVPVIDPVDSKKCKGRQKKTLQAPPETKHLVEIEVRHSKRLRLSNNQIPPVLTVETIDLTAESEGKTKITVKNCNEGIQLKGLSIKPIYRQQEKEVAKPMKKNGPFLTCVNIQKLKEKPPDHVDSPLSVESSGGGDNSDVVIIEDDPLAVSDPYERSAKSITLNSFQLDVEPTPPPASLSPMMTRGLRKRVRTEPEPVILSGGKRRKTKGKRQVDLELRRSIEEQKKQEISSSDEEKKNVSPKRKLQLLKTKKPEVQIDNDIPDIAVVKPPRKPRAAKKKTLMGLDIPENLLELDATISNVRQSRRIAQLKIKEEAERRKIEEITSEQKVKRKSKKNEDKDYKAEKRKKFKPPIEEEVVIEIPDVEEKKKKRKRKRKHKDPRKIFDESNPWRSSSDSSTSNDEIEEEEEEIVEYSEPESPLFKSDHEFSPESDIEDTEELQPLKRARTARKEDDIEDDVDEHACQKCGKSDHPEWILLCDGCDNGWHCSCLRPALLVIPEGDWFCPPCQHTSLVKQLEEKLVEYDKRLAKREIEVRRKERLAYVGISLANVLPVKDNEDRRKKTDDTDEDDSCSESESSSSSSSSSDSDEPIYQLRQRRQAHSYRFNDYDDLINSAIQDEMDAVKGAGNQGRGKDISTIVNAEKEEQAEQEKEQVEPLPPVVPVEEKELTPAVVPPEHDSDEDTVKPVKKFLGRKKQRKLNSLDDVSSGDDSDEDFKGSSSDEDEDDEFEDMGSDSSEFGGRRRKGMPVRRSTRTRTSRYDKDFINDNSDDEEISRKKKSRATWDESETEESDGSWYGSSRRKTRQIPVPRKRRSKKSKKHFDDSDDNRSKKKKRRIKYGGLDDDDEDEEIGRRTRGKKINYADVLASDSDEEVKRKAPPRIESDDDYVANEDQEDQDDDEEFEKEIAETEKTPEKKELENETPVEDVPKPPESDVKDIEIPAVNVLPEEPVVPQADPETPPENFDIDNLNSSIDDLPDDIPDDNDDDDTELNPIDEMNKNLEEMDEEEMEKLMEEEEYANKQLQLMAMQLEKEKKRKEREAKKKAAGVDSKLLKKRGKTTKQGEEEEEGSSSVVQIGTLQVGPDMQSNPELSEPPGVTIPIFSEIAPSPNVDGSPKKRRGRGKGKKTLEKEQAAAAAAAAVDASPAASTISLESPSDQHHIPTTVDTAASNVNSDNLSLVNAAAIHGAKLAIAAPPQPFSQTQPTPSVITRMLQSSGQGNYSRMGMGHNYYADQPPPHAENCPTPPISNPQMSACVPGSNTMPGNPTSGQMPPLSQQQYMHGTPPRGLPPTAYRQPPPNVNPYHRTSPAPPTRPRQPAPAISPVYHTHHPMDPSPSGGGSINVVSSSSMTTPDRSSPISIPPSSDSPLSNKSDPTPPPPPYSRPQMRFGNVNATPPMASSPIRQQQNLLPPQHIQQQASSPLRNNMPYPANVPPNYYGGWTGNIGPEESLPPSGYNYSDQFSETNSPQDISKSYDEENSGEFGGLVSYFSSQREDDLDT